MSGLARFGAISRRRLLGVAGALVLAAVWLGPLPSLARGAFTAHMIMHMGVVAVAAPLLALGLAGGRWDPVLRAPRAFAPVPASLLELVVVWAWHAPLLHAFARGSGSGLVLEQGSFLAVGLLVWLSAFGGESRGPAVERGRGRRVAGAGPRPARAAAGVIGLLLASMHMTLLGALLGLAPRPLYGHVEAVRDQQLGGAIMLLVGGAVYLAGGLALVAGLLREGKISEGAAVEEAA